MKSPLRFLALLLLSGLLAGCGPAKFDLDQPILFRMTDKLRGSFIHNVESIFEGALSNAPDILTGTGAVIRPDGRGFHPTSNIVIEVDLSDGNDPCEDKTLTVGAYASHLRDRIVICPRMLDPTLQLFSIYYSYMIYALVMHEFGHILGAKHVPCEYSWSIMVAGGENCSRNALFSELSQPEKNLRYSFLDLQEICRDTVGGMCDWKFRK